MTRRSEHNVEYLAGCHNADLEEVVAARHPLLVEGAIYTSAERFMGAIEQFGKGDMRVCIMLSYDDEIGLYIGLTPDGARSYAAALLKMAAIVETHVAEQASDAIEKARQRGDYMDPWERGQ
jgi:hypothetical protein